MLALALTLALTGTLAGCENDRGGDVPRIRAALAGLPGVVRVRDAVGWDSLWPFGPIDIKADLVLEGGGRLILCDLSLDALDGSRPFILARVGRWNPESRGARDVGRMRYVAGCPASVDIAPGSAFVELLPFEVHSVRDLVAHYSELNALIESWPHGTTRVVVGGGGWIEYGKSEAVETPWF